jgi:asparagine synthase (glutamine-hydrolysing)
MTAFATVAAADASHLSDDAVRRVGVELTRATGAPVGTARAGACTLLMSPLHRSDPRQPIVDVQTGIAVAGQVLLEDRQTLMSVLQLTGDASDLAIVAGAFARWGHGFAEHLTGEYAVALWDPNQHALLCARDGLGLRLLYVGKTARTFVVSNLLSSVLAHPGISRNLDDERLVAFLASGRASTATHTVYHSVQMLPEGHLLAIDLHANVDTLSRHWWMPAPEIRAGRDRREIPEGYRDVLAAAAADRSRDQPISIFMSGGVDSTSMAAAARTASPRGLLHAFTVLYSRLAAVDELSFATAAAERLALPLTMIEGDRHEALDAERGGLRLPQPLGEPTLADFRASLGRASQYSTVALYGEDGDAVFLPPGGRDLLRTGSFMQVARSAARYAITRRSRPYLGLRLRERVQRIAHARLNIAGSPPCADGITTPPWLTRSAIKLIHAPEPLRLFELPATSLPIHPTRSRTQDRLMTTVPPFAETIGPEVTQQKLELRFPLLDTRVLRYVFSVPPIPWCQHKELARAAFRGILPDLVLDRPKTPLVGFYEALVQSWRDRRGAEPPSVRSPLLREWIDERAWQHMLIAGHADDVMMAWRVIHLDAWLAERARCPEPLCTA